MSWSQITSNQEVTFNNLQDAVNTGVFTAKASIPASQKLINKTEANTYVYINTNYPPYLAKASNQLVVKGDLQSNPPVTTTTTTSIAPIYSSRIYGIDQFSTNSYGWPNSGYVLYSDNGGLNWTANSLISYSVSRNDTGQYVLAASSVDVQVSNNYGVSFTDVTLPGGFTYALTGTAMSNSGQYMFAIRTSGDGPAPIIYGSNNYGINWSIFYTYPDGNTPTSQGPRNKIATSGSGQYVLATMGALRKNLGTVYGCSFMRSTNYGVSFSTTDFNSSYLTDVAVSNTGQYQIMSKMSAFGSGNTKGQGALYWSNNFGGGFATKIYEENFRALYCAMSASGEYMVVAYINNTDSVNRIYFSTDFGVTWGYTGRNPTPPLRGPMPGGVFVAPDGSYALVTFVDWPEILYTTNFENWGIVNISPQAYKFGGLNKSRS